MFKEAIGRVKTTAKLITKSELDATDLLRADHMKVEAMLLQLRFIQSGEHRMRLLKQIHTDLSKHMKIEEEHYYPVAERVEEASELVEEAYREHEEIRGIISKLQKMNPTSTQFSKTVTQLIKTIEDHVMDEEDKIFPIVQSQLDDFTIRRVDREVQQAYGMTKPRMKTRAKVARKRAPARAARAARRTRRAA